MTSAIIFDLDGTLYDSKSIDAENERAAIAAICEVKNVDFDIGSNILKEARSKNGKVTSIFRAITDLGVVDDIYKKHQLINLHPEYHLSADLELVDAMRLLHAFYKFALLTNTRREIVNRILDVMGFSEDDFDLIIAGGDGFEPKPSVATLKAVVNRLGCEFSGSYTVGDRWIVDHEPGVVLGMNPVCTKNRSELLNWVILQIKNQR